VRLFAWEFSQPVLWANLLAWPIAYFCANRWLNGFAYHVDLQVWMFLSAGGIALMIALFTVSGQAFLAARAKPVTALRHE
jgi:putative ABC transport system permease protein